MKKLLSVLLALVMVVGLLGVAPFAVSAGTIVAEVEPNNSFAQAQALPLNSTLKGIIGAGSDADVDYYRMNLSKSGRVEFKLTQYFAYIAIRIFNDDGVEMGVRVYDWNYLKETATNQFTIDLEAGTYYISIDGSYYGGYRSGYRYTYYTGNYTLINTFTASGATNTEPDNDLKTASPLSINSTVKGIITDGWYSVDTDCYRFTMSRSGRMNFKLTQYFGYVNVNVYNDNGDLFWSSNYEWNYLKEQASNEFSFDLNAGTYYISIDGSYYGGYRSGYTYYTGNYTLTNNVGILPASVALNKTAATIGAGQTTTLTATVAPANATNKTITWSSNNTAVATVDSKGKVTAKKAGTATITAKSHNGKTKSAVITVKAAPTKIVLSKAVTLGVGEKFSTSVTITPTTALSTRTYTSSNTKIATVDKNGKITAKAVGTAKITVKTYNSKTSTVTVTVKKAPSKITLNNTKATVAKGKTLTFKAALPAKTASYARTWTTSNSKIATVSGGKITAKAKGTVT
ncbi:MAG: Ig-like domain-containing protein, partial [Oscillospiraceae bacterium]|nr:Ig-like domain-containing protein [Oscillospiraceae bacterium]